MIVAICRNSTNTGPTTLSDRVLTEVTTVAVFADGAGGADCAGGAAGAGDTPSPSEESVVSPSREPAACRVACGIAQFNG